MGKIGKETICDYRKYGEVMKKVMIIFSELFYGGAETQFRELVSRINKSEFAVIVVVSGAQASNADSENVKKYMDMNSEVGFYFLKHIYVPKSIVKKIRVYYLFRKQMKEIMEQERPDITLVYNGIELSGSSLYKRFGSKVIFSEREDGNRGKFKLLRYKWCFRNIDKIVCNSKEAQRYYSSKNIISDYIPNGIEKHEILEGAQGSIYKILVPARIAKVKNQELLIKALPYLKGKDYKVVFVGKQEDKEYLTYLQSLSKENGTSEHVEFMGFTNNMRRLYQNADLVVLPSRMEGFTNVLLESYMYGRLCLVSDIVMNKDVAAGSQRFFPVDDFKCLADHINKLMEIGMDDIEKEIDANHNYVIEQFALENMVSQYEKLFLDIVR